MSDVQSSANLLAVAARLERIESRIEERLGGLQKTPSDKAWDVITKLTVPAVLGLFAYGWRLGNDVDHLNRTSVSREHLQAALRELDARIVEAARGPEWLRNELVGIRLSVEAGAVAVNKLTERVVRMEATIGGEKR